MVDTAFWLTKEEAERDATATGLPMIPFGPLTGSAEIELLREVINNSDAQLMRQSMRISNQRAQLAERDVLLAEIAKRHWSGVDFDLPQISPPGSKPYPPAPSRPARTRASIKKTTAVTRWITSVVRFMVRSERLFGARS